MGSCLRVWGLGEVVLGRLSCVSAAQDRRFRTSLRNQENEYSASFRTSGSQLEEVVWGAIF